MYLRKEKINCAYSYVSILIFWNCFAFNCILLFVFVLLFVVFIVLSSIVVLIQSGQFLTCATIEFSERYMHV